MLYTSQEYFFYDGFKLNYLQRWFFYKRLNLNIKHYSAIDFWSKDKQKETLIYKSSLFLVFMRVSPKFIYRSGKITFKNKFKSDSLVVYDQENILINARHLLYFGVVFKKGDYKSLVRGIIYKELSDYIKSNYIDFYHFNVSLRIILSQKFGVSVLKSLFRLL